MTEKEKLLELNEKLLMQIEKLQKENEELKYENLNLKEEKMIDNSSCKPLNNFYDYYDCIPKDKIREKIKITEHFQEKHEEFDGENFTYQDIVNTTINAYKELLEEE